MFSKKLKPIFVLKKNLIRLGPKRDGGYIIDKRIIKKMDKYGYPYGLEISLIRSKLIKTKKKKNLLNYPIAKLDYPNVKRNKDIKLIFN